MALQAAGRLARALAHLQPCIPVHPANVHLLQRPDQFYRKLLDLVDRARKRVFLSSLYIGSSETELLDTLRASLRSKPDLHVHLHLDLNRSTRPGTSSTAHALLPLLRDYPSRFQVYLFRSPKLKDPWAKLVPPRFNEGWGTWHPKIYGADNDVMISGANLNRSYFTHRQDRYIHFSSEKLLADYCCDFLHSASHFSHRLLPQTDASPSAYTLAWPSSEIHPHYFESFASSVFSQLQHSFTLASQNILDSVDVVWVFPIIQAGQFNIREEERTLSLLFQHLTHGGSSCPTLMDLTSGYFGLYRPYQDLALQASQHGLHTRIVCAAPKANGFYGSSGISRRIPEGYTLLEQRFMRRVDLLNRRWKEDGASTTGVRLDEWERGGWTYHAKGIWLSPLSTSLPFLTLFGSTNLNSRSANLDTELSFLMLTPPSKSLEVLALREALAKEVRDLREYVRPWLGEERQVSWGTKAIVGVLSGML